MPLYRTDRENEFKNHGLSETLLKTYSIDSFINSTWAKFKGIVTKKTDSYSGYFFVSGNATEKDLQDALDWVQLYGYYPAFYSQNLSETKPYNENEIKKLIHNIDGFFVGICAKHMRVLDTESVGSKIIYHISYKEYQDKILSIGLVPKSSKKRENHPDRIYLCFSEDGLPALVGAYKKLRPKSTVICVQLKKEGLPELYLDLNFKYGCFSVKNINKKYIIKIEEV